MNSTPIVLLEGQFLLQKIEGKKKNPQFFMTCNINEILFRVKIDEHTTLARVGSIVNCVIDNLSNQTTLQSTAMEKNEKS